MLQNQKSIPTATVHEGAAAEARGQELGIPSLALIADSLMAGAAGAAASTEMHPVIYGGLRMWAETVEAARQLLAPHGWEVQRLKNVELITNPTLGVSLLVTASDARAGSDEPVGPQVRTPRREVTEYLLSCGAPNLFEPDGGLAASVWLLMHYRHQDRARGVGAELSLPAGLDRAGYVSSWVERILIPSLTDGGGKFLQSKPTVPSQPIVNVPVRRRLS